MKMADWILIFTICFVHGGYHQYQCNTHSIEIKTEKACKEAARKITDTYKPADKNGRGVKAVICVRDR
jgi:hypothetical protein